ncbi:PEP-CTERM motif protein [Pseudobythopirellula maris]|uniref:PEP-CTERM motif protein n=1 Tax=Pseudobythopirellula maris TaxID=2527991 RepID=A0A5C5ZME1_9BACT|nr:PEP-CTERM sorting domain-containing protein [Pseudobythopirellula maris]TWT87613.1 PEP-CTERM motif protein [Pseudobythopirellula maris]
MSLKSLALGAGAALITLLTLNAASAQSVSLFSENFESLVLGPVVTFESERRSNEAWTETPPAGWTVDDSGVPTDGIANVGVAEYEGWSFVSKEWWVDSAGGQDRQFFTGGSGIVAVADPDEWDDFPDFSGVDSPSDYGDYDARLLTPAINLSGAPSGEDVKIFFNSSWRPEDNQKASLTATFNDSLGTQYELLRYESQEEDENEVPNPFFKDDAPNEAVLISLIDDTLNGGHDFSIPDGATEVSLEFRLFDAANDWWWAFDNLEVFTGENPVSGLALKLVVDRDTNEVRIVNETGSPVDLRGYSVTSGAGAFEEAEASFMAPANNWLQATRLDDESNDLSELNLLSDALAADDSIEFGDVWRRFYLDESDVAFEYLVAGSDEPIPGLVEFIGNEQENDEGVIEPTSYEFLDLNYDSKIDLLDWEKFKTGFGKSMLGKTRAERYALGDLNDDERHDSLDFQQFQSSFDAANGEGAFAAALSAPEPGALVLALFAVAAVLAPRGLRRAAPLAAVLAIACCCGTASAQLKLYEEDFESAVLGAFQEEDVDGDEVWTNTFTNPIYGAWNNTNANDDVPGVGPAYAGVDPKTDGISDWADWAFVDKAAWFEADDQGRSDFTRGSGVVMVADPDEWDDTDPDPLLIADPNLPQRDDIAQGFTPDDLYDAFVTTPTISIPAGTPAGRIKLSFDSSWRGNEFEDDLDENNNQTAHVNVSFDGGLFQEVFRRESDPDSPTYDPSQENERVSGIDLMYDGSATELQLEFGMTGAWNDWWWAIDNISVAVPSNPLKLRINTYNGEGFLEADDSITTAIEYLGVESENGVLRGDLATGLAGADLDPADGPDAGATAGDSEGEQWESLSDAETSDHLFADAFLFGDTAFADETSTTPGVVNSAPLGVIFDTLTSPEDRDVRFSYLLDTGDLVEVAPEDVEYFYDASAGLAGDYNNDGSVDAADFTVWRDNLGDPNENALSNNGDGQNGVDIADYDRWVQNYGARAAVSGPSSAVPEPGSAALLALAATALAAVRRRATPVVVAAAALAGVAAPQAEAQVTLDRDYTFGDDSRENATAGGVVGQNSPGGISIDSAGDTGMNQIISLLPQGPVPTIGVPKYVAVSDRPDMLAGSNAPASSGLGIALNPSGPGSAFSKQYLHTGYREALNYPQYSPSSVYEQGGTINYDLISDRGFQLWVKPTAIDTGEEAHIVMDTNQHGVMINTDGEFAMRYAYDRERIEALATLNGQPASDFENVFDYPSGVTAEVGQWTHLSVVREFGPGSGSILYINGVATAAALGKYNIEEDVTSDEPAPDPGGLDVSPLVVGANTGSPAYGNDHFFYGVVDDLEMFVMGQNADNLFPDYVFENDNGYAAAFKPTTAGDLDGDDDVTLADAHLFAANWMSVKELEWTDAYNVEQTFVVGDLETRGMGDFNYDGRVDLSDWAILHNASPSTATAAARLIAGQLVPEPGSLSLLLAGLAAAGRRRRREAGRTGEATPLRV